MMVLFFRAEPRKPHGQPLPDDLELRIWRPAIDGPPPPRRFFASNLIWWVLTRIGCFARSGFCEVTIWRGRILRHRLLVTPRWHRFPFMAADDLQIGAVWTAGTERRRGLARHAMAIALDQARDAPTIWYVAEAENLASRALAEASGMRLVAIGERSAPLGLRVLGQFRIVRSAGACISERSPISPDNGPPANDARRLSASCCASQDAGTVNAPP
jgi:RimJ/RimL family protein N-acetyltransferase